MRQVIALPARFSMWFLPIMIVVGLVTLDGAVFYLCLYREQNLRGLVLVKRLRLISIAGALALCADTAIRLPVWIGSFGPGPDASVLAAVPSPWTLFHLSAVLSACSIIASILPLIAFSCLPLGETSPRVPVSKLLRVVTTIAVVAWGLIVLYCAIILLMTPWTYSQLRNYALQAGITPPSFGSLATKASRNALEQFGLFVAPYVIWRSTSTSRV